MSVFQVILTGRRAQKISKEIGIKEPYVPFYVSASVFAKPAIERRVMTTDGYLRSIIGMTDKRIGDELKRRRFDMTVDGDGRVACIKALLEGIAPIPEGEVLNAPALLGLDPKSTFGTDGSIDHMVIADLKKQLKFLGLATNGNKKTLVDRLKKAMQLKAYVGELQQANAALQEELEQFADAAKQIETLNFEKLCIIEEHKADVEELNEQLADALRDVEEMKGQTAKFEEAMSALEARADAVADEKALLQTELERTKADRDALHKLMLESKLDVPNHEDGEPGDGEGEEQ